MNLSEDHVIGIVGGMGPEAGLALFKSILCNTQSATDQDHLSVMLMSFPKHIVDRTLFIEGSISTNPALNIVQIIRKLERAGAKTVVIACNTSYSPEIYNVITEELNLINSRVKLLHMPLETCKYIKQYHSSLHRIGLMTTNGTYKSKVYKDLLLSLGYDVIVPDFSFQDSVIHDMIYHPKFGIKSNSNTITSEARSLLNRALQFFKTKGSEAIILGCTELSLILKERVVEDMLIVDSTEVMAKVLISKATDSKNISFP